MGRTPVICYGASNVWGYDPANRMTSRYPEDCVWTSVLARISGRKVVNCGLCGREIPTRQRQIEAAAALLSRYGRELSEYRRELIEEDPSESDAAKPAPEKGRTDASFNPTSDDTAMPGSEKGPAQREDKTALPSEGSADSILTPSASQSGDKTASLSENSVTNPQSGKTAVLRTPELWIMLGTNDLLKHADFRAEDAAARMENFVRRLKEELSPQPSRIRLLVPPAMRPGVWVDEERLITESLRLNRTYPDVAKRLGIACIETGGWELPLAFDGVHLTEEGHRIFAEKLAQTL